MSPEGYPRRHRDVAGCQILIRKKDQGGRRVSYAAQVGPLARDEANRNAFCIQLIEMPAIIGRFPFVCQLLSFRDLNRSHFGGKQISGKTCGSDPS